MSKDPISSKYSDKEITASIDSRRQPGFEVGSLAASDKLRVTKTLTIKKIEVLAAQYNKWYHKVILLTSAFICGYGYGLDSVIRPIYTSYATNSYSEHSLLSTITVINGVVSVGAQILSARLSDVFGRLPMFITAIAFYVAGTIIQSQAYDVQRYAAGAVFYNAGNVSINLVLTLILSDCSSMKWRLFYQFVPVWPYIINTWVSGNITSRANPLVHWSWDIGMWAFIFPLSAIPMLACMIHMRMKAKKTPEWQEICEKKSFYQTHGTFQTLIQLFWQLDIVGVILLTASLGCILVPLTLAGGFATKWHEAGIIVPLVLGGVLLPVFVYWENSWARQPLAPPKLLKDRGIWAGFCISNVKYFIYYMAADYMYTVMIVAVNESVKSASRILSMPAFVATVASPFFALLITRSRRLKPYIISGCAIWVLALGLLYHYRGGSESHSGIIAGLCLLGLGSVLFTYPVTVSMQSVTTHENMAIVTALSYSLLEIGAAVGASVSGAVWTQTLYKDLVKRMENPSLALDAYSSPYKFIVEFAWGTPEREAMVQSYKYVQRLETLIGLVFTAPLLFLAFFLRDPKLTDKVASEKIEEGECINDKDGDPITEWILSRFNFIRGKKNN